MLGLSKITDKVSLNSDKLFSFARLFLRMLVAGATDLDLV